MRIKAQKNNRSWGKMFLATIATELDECYQEEKNHTPRQKIRQRNPLRRKQSSVNKKFEAQMALFKDYKANPTKQKFDRLFNDNLGIVTFTVNRWFSHSAFQSKRDDMIQEGSIGLMSAIRKFNPDFDKKFSPYAILWVKQAIVKYVLTDKSVRLPMPLMSAIKRFNENPEQFELDQQDPGKAKAKGFKEMLDRYHIQRFDVSLDEEFGNAAGEDSGISYKDLLVTNIDNSYSGSASDGSANPFIEAGNIASFTTYDFDSDNPNQYAEYIDVLTHMTRKDIVVVALRYGFSEDEAVIFADLLQAMEQKASEDAEHQVFTGLRQFSPVEKRGTVKQKKQKGVKKRKYITRKDDGAADFRTISEIVKELGFSKVNHATARNIVNSRLFDIAEFMNTKRATETEPNEVKKLTEDQIKSIILTSPAFHQRVAEVLKGSYAYLLMHRSHEGINEERR